MHVYYYLYYRLTAYSRRSLVLHNHYCNALLCCYVYYLYYCVQCILCVLLCTMCTMYVYYYLYYRHTAYSRRYLLLHNHYCNVLLCVLFILLCTMYNMCAIVYYVYYVCVLLPLLQTHCIFSQVPCSPQSMLHSLTLQSGPVQPGEHTQL